MVIVESGPALLIPISRLSEKSVGSQFLVAHPGRLGTAKQINIAQKAMLLKSQPKPCRKLLSVNRCEVSDFTTVRFFGTS